VVWEKEPKDAVFTKQTHCIQLHYLPELVGSSGAYPPTSAFFLNCLGLARPIRLLGPARQTRLTGRTCPTRLTTFA
jgi:hypothetical protein